MSFIRDRLEILWKLLRQDGYLAIQIDDNQFARLYILMSELFGEKNLKTICVKMSEATGVKMASVNKIGIVLFSSPFDETAIELLERLDCPAYKIASFDDSSINKQVNPKFEEISVQEAWIDDQTPEDICNFVELSLIHI